MSRILHEVSENREEVRITHHGKVPAQLVPPQKAVSPEESVRLTERVREPAGEAGGRAPRGVSATDLLDKERRRP